MERQHVDSEGREGRHEDMEGGRGDMWNRGGVRREHSVIEVEGKNLERASLTSTHQRAKNRFTKKILSGRLQGSQ